MALNALDWHSLICLIKFKVLGVSFIITHLIKFGFASFLVWKSSKCSSTIQWQKEAIRYNVVTMATKMDFHFLMKMGHFAKKKKYLI